MDEDDYGEHTNVSRAFEIAAELLHQPWSAVEIAMNAYRAGLEQGLKRDPFR